MAGTVSKNWMTADLHDPNVLAAYIDGTLDQDERSIVVAHLAGCGACRAALAAYVKGTTEDGETGQGPRRAWIAAVRPRVWMPIAATIALVTVAGVLQRAQRRADQVPQAPPVVETPSAVPDPSSGVPPGVSTTPPSTADAPLPPRPSPPVDERTMRVRGAERRVGDKRFRLVAGEWIDAAYDPMDPRPVVAVTTPAERAVLLERLPALRPFADLGERVIVVHGGSVYKFGRTESP